MRLTDKTSVEFMPECSKVNPLATQGKCPYYEQLAEYEDFMEKNGFITLEDLQRKIDNWVNEQDVKDIATKTIKDYLVSEEFQKELNNHAIYKLLWNDLKEKLKLFYTFGKATNSNGFQVYNAILDTMQELEE